MDAVEFLKQYSRMVKFGVQPFNIPSNLPYEEIVSRVEQWAKEHPVKTRQSELKKLFPDLTLEDGWFCMCPKYVGQKECIDGPFEKSTCDKCRRDFWLAETKDGDA